MAPIPGKSAAIESPNYFHNMYLKICRHFETALSVLYWIYLRVCSIYVFDCLHGSLEWLASSAILLTDTNTFLDC